MLKTVILLITFGTTSLACTCAGITQREAFCDAHWVSHVMVEDKKEVKNADQVGTIRYTVKHLEIFKKPKGSKGLSSIIVTTDSEESCGVTYLDKNKEYLVAGILEKDSSISISICGQIVDPIKLLDEVVVEWKDVPNDLKSKLHIPCAFKCNYRKIVLKAPWGCRFWRARRMGLF